MNSSQPSDQGTTEPQNFASPRPQHKKYNPHTLPQQYNPRFLAPPPSIVTSPPFPQRSPVNRQ